MGRPTREVDWAYGLLWVVANAVAWAIGLALPYVVRLSSDASELVWAAAGVLLMGSVQWWVLSRRFPHTPWWLVGYGLAWFVALVVGAYLGFVVPDPVWVGGISGTAAGIMQCLVLGRHVRRSIAWLPAMIASEIVGLVAGVKVGWFVYSHDMSEAAAYAIGCGVAGATFGILSAIVLLYLVRKARRGTVKAQL